MTRNDKTALTLALKQACAESEGRAEQIASMLEDRDRTWFEVASFAAFSAQCRSLALQPWESPPCIADGFHGDASARKLLRQMLAAGISRYHPDPLGALEEAKRKGAA